MQGRHDQEQNSYGRDPFPKDQKYMTFEKNVLSTARLISSIYRRLSAALRLSTQIEALNCAGSNGCGQARLDKIVRLMADSVWHS